MPLTELDASFFADLDAVVTSARGTWKPPPRLTLSEWADEKFYLSAESSAQGGRWSTIPYQREPMDAITDPRVETVTLMKAARVGYTKMIDAGIGYHVEHAPCSMLVVQPTVEDAKGYSKEEIAPMLRDCPSLSKIVFEDEEESAGPREGRNTILHKKFPGGILSMIGANSGTGFRRISRRIVFFDEVDGYPMSAGSDGDPVRLGIKRTEFFHDRKIVLGSTPKVAGHSRIETSFEQGDQRRYYVPCPHCGHEAPLVFRESDVEKGHYMKWPEGKPKEAFFVCRKNGCVIEHKDKRAMVERGRWIAAKPFDRHASFHIWTAYSYSPNATWGQIAEEFLAAKHEGRESLKVFINTVLGETWKEKGAVPEWELLYLRREQYPIGSVPEGVEFLTAGVDVQQDRFVYEVVGWGPNRESWSIECGVLPADTGSPDGFKVLNELLARQFRTAKADATMSILVLAIDSGFQTQNVYNWGRAHQRNRVMAVKGQASAKTMLSSPSPVDVHWNGQRITRGYVVWPVGVDIAKAELYGWLRQLPPTKESGDELPPGFCHFPEYGEDFFKQLTAEHLVSVTRERTGFTVHEWQLQPGRENHYLDARVYARAAAAMAGVDRLAPKAPKPPPAPVPVVEERRDLEESDSRFLGGRGKGWFKR